MKGWLLRVAIVFAGVHVAVLVAVLGLLAYAALGGELPMGGSALTAPSPTEPIR